MTLAVDKTVAPSPAANPASPAFPGFVQVSIVGIFLILAVGAMYYARSFFLPLVLALLVRLVFAPLVHTLAAPRHSGRAIGGHAGRCAGRWSDNRIIFPQRTGDGDGQRSAGRHRESA